MGINTFLFFYFFGLITKGVKKRDFVCIVTN